VNGSYGETVGVRRRKAASDVGREGVAAGLMGTTAMTLTLWAERRARRRLSGPVDYDASDHVVTAACAVLGVTPSSDLQRKMIFLLVHWGYGSMVGVGYPGLLRITKKKVAAGILFYVGCQSMAFALFPTLGGTPPPWRWRRDMLASSLLQHAVYAGVVAVGYERLSDDRREASNPQ
jgi:hypothetical protein